MRLLWADAREEKSYVTKIFPPWTQVNLTYLVMLLLNTLLALSKL